MAAEIAFQEVINHIVMSKLNFSIYQTPFSAQLSLKKSFAKPFDENKSTVKVQVENADTTNTKASQLELEMALHKKDQEILRLQQVIKENERANDILKNNCEAMENILDSERKKTKKEKQKVRRCESKLNQIHKIEVTDNEHSDEEVIPEVKTSNRFSSLLSPVDTFMNVDTKPKENETNDSIIQTDIVKCEKCSTHSQCCDLCDENFKNISDLRKHMHMKHLKDKCCQVSSETLPKLKFEEYQCYYCAIILKSEEDLEVHSTASHEQFLSDFHCIKCGENCLDKADLGFHKFSQHGPFAKPSPGAFKI